MGETWKSWVIVGLIVSHSNFVGARSQSDSVNDQSLIEFYQSRVADKSGDKPEDSRARPREATQIDAPSLDSPKPQSLRPLGEIKGPLPPGCHPRDIENHLLKQNLTSKDFALLAEAYFTKCEKFWNGPEKSGKSALLDFVFTKYDLSKNKKIQLTTISLRDGTKVQAYIGMQDGFTKRPWVIAKCGVFCTVTESSSVGVYIMHFFDQSPFNIIFLSNRTGVDYIESNERLTLGGYLEAHDYYEIGRWLKEESPYKDTVDSLHVFGMSLAGNAAAFVEPLADAYGYDEDNRLFQSIISLCPVINLKPTIDDMYTDKSKRNIFSKLTWDELQEVKPALHEVDDLLNRKSRPDYSEFPDLMGSIVSHYALSWGRSPYTYRKTREIESIEDLWELNQFSNLQKEIKTPLLVWGSMDDSIVSNELNTATLPESWVYKNSKNLGVLNVNYGDHCALATSYGYPVTAAVLRSFIESHSKRFLEGNILRKRRFNFELVDFGLRKHLRQWWQAYPNLNYATITFESFSNVKRPWCFTKDIYSKKSSECRVQTEVKVPLQVFNSLAVKQPTNSTEAEILSRKLNALLRVTSSGHALEGRALPPNQIEWFDHSL